MLNRIRLIVFGLLFAQLSNADILFIDLNNVEAEISVAKQEAAKRGEKLVVIPLNREKLKQEAATKKTKLRAYERAMTAFDRCESSNRPNCVAPEYRDYFPNLTINQVMNEMYGGGGSYGKKELEEDLKKIDPSVKTIMISGHDGNGSFYGDFGKVSGDEFRDVFKNFEGSKEVNSLYLLGCESAASDVMGATWKSAFPNARFIAGYENTGYLRESPQGHQFIRNLLSNEKEILASANVRDALEKFKKISPSDSKYGASACFQSDLTLPVEYFSAKNRSGKLEDLLKCQHLDDFEKVQKFLNCAQEKSKPCFIEKLDPIRVPEALRLCQFKNTDGKYSYSEKIKNQLYLLGSLSSETSELSIKAMFAQVDPELKKTLKLDEPIADYNDLLEKVLAIRNFYSKGLEFDDIKKSKLSDLAEKAQQKEKWDNYWLGLSNLELGKMLRYWGNSDPGRLRAQAFYDAAVSKKTNQSIVERIEEVERESNQYISEVAAEKRNLVTWLNSPKNSSLEEYKTNYKRLRDINNTIESYSTELRQLEMLRTKSIDEFKRSGK